MIIVKLMGGLGNQMFQYAFGRCLAIKTNSQLKLDLSYLENRGPNLNYTVRDYDLSIFNVCENFIKPEETESFKLVGNSFNRLQKIIVLRRQGKHYLNEKTILLYKNVFDIKEDLYLDGYWQNEKYFKNIESIIRQDFTFKTPLDTTAEATAKEILETTAVSLNIRRGDYLKHQKFLYLCSKDYYIQAMDTIARTVSNPTFFIFSDEVDWCRTNLPFSKYPIKFINRELAGVKFQSYLKLVMLCKHHIISNSTFAWWGAWLNPSKNKIVISPRKWIRSLLYYRHNIDINPAGWIKL